MNSSPKTEAFADQQEQKEIFIVAGEVSGDEHAALAVSEMKKLNPGAHFFGMGGRHMREAGVETVVDSEKAGSVMGLTEVLGKLGVILKARKKLIEQIRKRKPKLAVLVDFPDFNFSLFKTLEKEGVPVVYYVTPQLWAWRKGRAKTIKRHVTKVLSIFPFEESFFSSLGIKSKYIGHPFTDREAVKGTREDFFQENGLESDKETLALLPGSRNSELERLFPTMIEAFSLLRRSHPELQGVVPVAENLDFTEVKNQLEGTGIVPVLGKAREVLSFSNCAVVASGTATVEAAMSELPFIVIYKLAPLTYRLAKILVKGVSNFAMVNLIAEEKIVPELLQDQCNPKNIADEISKILDNKSYKNKMLEDLKVVSNKLEVKGDNASCSSERVAREIDMMLRAL